MPQPAPNFPSDRPLRKPLSRRSLVKGAAWAAPVVGVAIAAPLASASSEITSVYASLSDVGGGWTTWGVYFELSPAVAITPVKEMFFFTFPNDGGVIHPTALTGHQDYGDGSHRVEVTLPLGWGFTEGINTVTMTFEGRTATGNAYSLG